MKRFKNKLATIGLLGAVALVPLLGAAREDLNETWFVSGTEPLIIGGYGDNYQYDGEQVRPIDGWASIDVDSAQDEGRVIAEIVTGQESGPIHFGQDVFLEGRIRLVMDRFVETEPFMAGGLAAGLILHGDSGRMSPLMPELYAHLIGWGLMDVYVDGELRFEDLEGHFMLTERVRRGPELGYAVVRTSDGAIYDPELEDKSGFSYAPNRELHLWVASPESDPSNYPQRALFLHLNFAEVVSTANATSGSGISGLSSTPSNSPPDQDREPDRPDLVRDRNPNRGPKGNNGVGNGEDPQPPGNPPVNDGEGSGKGNPENRKKGK